MASPPCFLTRQPCRTFCSRGFLRLSGLLSRTLVLELHAAGLENRLPGETPEERFRSFIALLRHPSQALEILRRYPVLARGAVETVDRWVTASLEFLCHLRDDAAALRDRFFLAQDPGLLVEVEANAGDVHRGGRSVLLLRFDSGLRLVYKPRPVAVEACFQDLLTWTGAKGFRPLFRNLEILDRGGHGWVEHVQAGSCGTKAEVRCFYQRQGGYLAILYALDATDFHNENLIAVGEHPVLVDLETLFHPWVESLGRADSEESVGRPLHDSALRVGMLPMRIWGDGEQAGVDLSGLGGKPGQTLVPVMALEDLGTDRMRFGRRSIELPAAKNRPRLREEDIQPSDYTEAIVEGFDRMYGLLAEHRRELLAGDSPLTAFAAAEVRVVIRPTQSYGLVLAESLHPQALGDGLARDRLLDRLWIGVEDQPFLERLVRLEQREVRRGDVPIFTTRPDSRDLWTGDGERLPEVLSETGLDRVKRNLANLGEEDRARQTWIIRGALKALVLEQQDRPSYELIEAVATPARSDLLEAALAVGHRLEALALRGHRDAHWLTVQSPGNNAWTLAPASLDLHLGLPGIVLFLARLADLTGEPRPANLARAAATSFLELLDRAPRLLNSLGAFSGWVGVIYTLTHLGRLWDDDALLDRAEAVAATLPELIARDPYHDVVGGAAGCLVTLLGLHRLRPDSPALEMARRCGERILGQARTLEQGIGWVIEVAGPKPLAGFSHGAAGIAWALLQLGAATGDRKFREAALEALRYERTLYFPTERNWIDLRQGYPEDGDESHFLCAWCHGASGIGLARVDGLPYLNDPEVRQEIAVAIETTLRKGFGKNHCLCHGDLGNLELLTLAADRLEDAGLNERAGRIAGGILAGIRQHGWLFGLPQGVEPTGMMIGLSGVGYGLLRLAEPQRVPSVLLLAPPESTGSTAPHGMASCGMEKE